jgi:N,N-dimethylformamidase
MNHRRVFLTLISFTFLLSCFAGSEQKVEARTESTARTLVGYSSELTVRPGDTVEFMVSVIGGGVYEADLVRVINGDLQSRYKNMFKVEPVTGSFAGKYNGVEQPLNLGSYAHIEKTGALDVLGSFTVGAWIYPTFDPTEYKPPDLENIDPFSPPTLNIAPLILDHSQTIVSRFDNTTGKGWALRIDKEFHLEFVAGDGNGKLRSVRIDQSVRDWDWAYVAASYDADHGIVTVYLREKPLAPGDQFTARNLEVTGKVDKLIQGGPLRIAAVRDGAGAARAKFEKPGDVFNGRIQDVRIANRVLTDKEIDALSSEKVQGLLKIAIVADWDFAKDMKTTKIRDVSGNGLDGVAVNIPDRAVRGRFWEGSTIKWTDDPDQYDAITFYADDLYDAEWKADFTYTVSDDLPCGIYAARLKQGGFTEYITFFAAAPKGKPRAELALWLSDYNYLAYANTTIGVTAAKNYPGQNLSDTDTEFYKAHLVYGTGGVYNCHVDGRNFSYGSRKRPDLAMKPGSLTYNFVEDTHITAFLEHEGIAYDIITDELVDAEGLELLRQYRLVISSTHQEYLTGQSLDNIAAYTAQGGRFIYIGANGWFWSVGGHPELPGVVESRNFHDIADRYLRNGERGGLMVETGRQTGPVLGVEMAGMIFNGSSPYRKQEDAANSRVAWIFEGTNEGEVFGDYGVDRVHGGACGFEVDRYVPGNGVPRHALVLATSEPLRPTIEDVKMSQLPLSIIYHPNKADPWAQSDMVFFETPKGGAMFSTGSIAWISSTLQNDFDNDVATITRNVVKRFLDPLPFPPVGEQEVEDADRLPENPEYEWADQH